MVAVEEPCTFDATENVDGSHAAEDPVTPLRPPMEGVSFPEKQLMLDAVRVKLAVPPGVEVWLIELLAKPKSPADAATAE